MFFHLRHIYRIMFIHTYIYTYIYIYIYYNHLNFENISKLISKKLEYDLKGTKLSFAICTLFLE